MLLRKLLGSIRSMPRAAYIMLRFTLTLCCVMLLGSFAAFVRFEQSLDPSRSLYMLAVLLLENPAGVLLVGGICAAYFIDHA